MAGGGAGGKEIPSAKVERALAGGRAGS